MMMTMMAVMMMMTMMAVMMMMTMMTMIMMMTMMTKDAWQGFRLSLVQRFPLFTRHLYTVQPSSYAFHLMMMKIMTMMIMMMMIIAQ